MAIFSTKKLLTSISSPRIIEKSDFMSLMNNAIFPTFACPKTDRNIFFVMMRIFSRFFIIFAVWAFDGRCFNGMRVEICEIKESLSWKGSFSLFLPIKIGDEKKPSRKKRKQKIATCLSRLEINIVGELCFIAFSIELADELGFWWSFEDVCLFVYLFIVLIVVKQFYASGDVRWFFF